MVDDFHRAANFVNEGIATQHQLTGTYPKDMIQKIVEQWYFDSKKDYQSCINTIEFISNKSYQKTAYSHLDFVRKYGYRHLKFKNANDDEITNANEGFLFQYFIAFIWLPAAFGAFLIFSKKEVERKQAIACILAIATWVLFFWWISK